MDEAIRDNGKRLRSGFFIEYPVSSIEYPVSEALNTAIFSNRVSIGDSL
jgi:hypothetical protein